MFEKDLRIGFLLDFYGEVLTERKRTVLDLYYNDDLSLSEIADELGVSRQAVREMIGKASSELLFLEEKLKLAARFQETQSCAERLLRLLDETEVDERIHRAAEELAKTVR